MPRAVIAISNGKGGVGKTTTCATLAVGLLEHGPILIVDMDPAGALSSHFGVVPGRDEKTIYHGLLEQGTALRDVIRTVRPGLDIIPANRDFSAGEQLLTLEPGGDVFLRDALGDLGDRYRVILIDSPPNLGKLTVNTLVAATGVIIPLTPSYLDLGRMQQTMATVEAIRSRLNPGLSVFGILLTQHRRVKHAEEVEQRVRSLYPGLVYETTIPQSVRFQEAPAGSMTILDYEPEHPGAVAYRTIAREVINRVENETHHAPLS